MSLETERLILRKPKINDINDHNEGINDINISKNLLIVKYPYSKKCSKDWIREWMKEKIRN